MAKFKLRTNVPLKSLTTFQVGGSARYLAEVEDEDQLIEAVNFTKEKRLGIFVLGGGSDILMSDEGFDGLVIRYKDKSIEFDYKNKHVLVTAAAGVIWDDLVASCVKKGLQGIECMSGIPGTVGASPIQNIGAYGQELKDGFVRLSAFDFKDKRFVTFDKRKCEFSYRESVFKKKKAKRRYLITKVTLRLRKSIKPTVTYESLRQYLDGKGIKNPNLAQVRKAVLALRGQKMEDPGVLGNAGSFFKNPIIERKLLKRLKQNYPEIPYYPAEDVKVKLFAGWLVEHAGWKGKRFKNAMVSEKNALVITNPKGRASAKEVRELAQAISKDVYKKFKVKLEPEVQFIGFN
ncbi:UDP-N-acetylmuramate dehydrogenase [Patescibacteria group bacterium]|nr:UDP-N-acetylmuramate dehydrogenase [Patescibacteria group bacterium]